MVMDHPQPLSPRVRWARGDEFGEISHLLSVSPIHSPRIGRQSEGSRTLAAFATCLLLTLIGCQTVVDPGRSQGVITAPHSGPLLIPPQVPVTNQPDPSGVIRQPVSAVLQLPQTEAAEAKYHTVSQGETWSSISRKYQLSVQDLTNSNGLDPATPLQAGQMVYLPSN